MLFLIKNQTILVKQIIFRITQTPKEINMNFKKIGLAMIVASTFAFVACDDSTSASNEATGGDEQPTLSSASNEAGGDVASSESNGGTAGDEKTASSTDSNGDKTAASSDSNGGEKSATSTDSNGDQTAASSDSNGAAATSSADATPKSSADFGGMTGFDTTNFQFDSTAFADMMKCDEEGAVQNMMGAAVLVCTNGQWVYDSTATAAANACTEEGATKTETMSFGGGSGYDMTYVCKNGQWQMDFSGMSFGDSTWTGGFGGDSTWSGGMNFGDSSFTMPGGMNFGDSSFTMPGGMNFGGGNFGGGAGDVTPPVAEE